jgi:hydroxyacylglutathione hydrolase
MHFELIASKGLAHNSYFLADGGEALVVDPRRDVQIYLDLAKRACAKITYIVETHRNEDYVIGSVELQMLTDAEIAHSKETPFKYGEHQLVDGDVLNVGRFRIEALYTPGHTNESICYVVSDPQASKEPIMVFTGDTLFVGDVGRTDLPGLDVWEKMSEKQYNSIHNKLFSLGDHVLVYPGHGAGSICGHKLSDRNISTLGYERLTNPLFKLSKEEFVNYLLRLKLYRPPYFRKMETYNLAGPPLLKEVPSPRALSVHEFEEALQEPNTILLDAREPAGFAGSHIPDSINIWLEGLSFFPGWVINYDQDILLVLERQADLEEAQRYLWRIGFDKIIGYLCPGISEWRDKGKAIDTIRTLSASELKKRLETKEVELVDVREYHEKETGIVKDATDIFVGFIPDQGDKLSKTKPIVTTCGWGGRGSIAASLLKHMGFKEIYNLMGGMRAWKARGYPLVKPDLEWSHPET